MAGAWSLVATLLWWRSRAAAPYVGLVALLFLLTALIRPPVLGPIERAWMKLAALMAAVMTRVILTLTFYLVITPVGLLLRLLRKDVLGLRPDPGAQSFWVPVEPDGPGTRPDRPF
jgi:hypothetical protein